MGGSSQQPVTQQTTQTRDPWSQAQPYLTNIMGQAANFYNAQAGYQPYTGQTQAALDPRLQQGLEAQAGIAQGSMGGTPGILASQAAGTDLIKNQGLSPELKSLYEQAQGDQNPYLEGVIRQGVNAANAGASGMGRYGSGGHDAAITQAMSPVLAQDYARRQQQMQGIAEGGLQRAGQWAQLMPTLDQAQYAPAQAMAATGQYFQDRGQAQLNDIIKQYNAQQSYPWEQLSRYNAIVGGAGALGGTNVTASPIQQPSTLQRVLGGGAAGAGIGGSFGGPAGAGVGAGIGGLLGLL